MEEKKPVTVYDVLNKIYAETQVRLSNKGVEYDESGSIHQLMQVRLKNIRTEARMNNLLPSQMLQVLIGKHAMALLDTKKFVSKEEFEERAIDIVAYFVLWLGLYGDD